MRKTKTAFLIIKTALLILEMFFAAGFVLMPAIYICAINWIFTLNFQIPSWVENTWVFQKADQWMESIQLRTFEN